MNNNLQISLSEGEILDRYSILEIKYNKINDTRKNYVLSELKDYSRFNIIKERFILYYKLLYFINNKIWDLQVIIKQITYLNEKYAIISYDILESNQSRFRIKNIINNISNSIFKEQKGYDISENTIHIKSDDINYIYLIIYGILLFDNINIQFDYNVSDNFKNKILYLFPSLKIVNNSNTYLDIDIFNKDNNSLYNFINNELSVIFKDKI